MQYELIKPTEIDNKVTFLKELNKNHVIAVYFGKQDTSNYSTFLAIMEFYPEIKGYYVNNDKAIKSILNYKYDKTLVIFTSF